MCLEPSEGALGKLLNNFVVAVNFSNHFFLSMTTFLGESIFYHKNNLQGQGNHKINLLPQK